MHPDAGRPYRWLTDRTLLDVSIDELPHITERQVANLLDELRLRFDEVLIDQDSDFEEVWEMRETQAVYASISADLISDHVSSGLDLTAAQERVELESEFYLHDPITGPLVTDPATPRGRQMANQ